jgi:hypothetical protein
MNLANLNLVLRARATADIFSGGLFIAGSSAFINAWNWNAVPEDTAYPYVIQSIASLVSRNAMQKDIVECRVRFGIWHTREAQADVDPYLTVSAIEARIYGNWSSASPTVAPTYGFHKFQPSLSGWSATVMEYVQTFDESDKRRIHIIPEFRFWLSA